MEIEERETWDAWRSGDRAAGVLLVRRHLSLAHRVAHVVKATAPRAIEYDDLAAEAAIGLLDAIARFDPDAGTEFPPYAWTRIRGAALDYVRNMAWANRSIMTSKARVREAEYDLAVRGRHPTDEMLAAALDMTIARDAGGHGAPPLHRRGRSRRSRRAERPAAVRRRSLLRPRRSPPRHRVRDGRDREPGLPDPPGGDPGASPPDGGVRQEIRERVAVTVRSVERVDGAVAVGADPPDAEAWAS